MTNDTPEPDIAKIRQLLLAAFTPEELDRLFRFSSDPQLQKVVTEFGPGDGFTIMVDKAISYCHRHLLLADMLAQVKLANPRQYARFLEPDQTPDEPDLSTPDILTISQPISLHLVRIPAGEFRMGSVMARDKDAEEDELPPHRVYIPEFHIGQYPVTNLQYRAFVQVTGHRPPRHWGEGRIPYGRDNHPVENVTWQDVIAFCDWLSRETKQPFRLPTEAEWEKAARGTDGRIYPWGDGPPDENRCNFGRNVEDTTTIGRYSPQGDSPYGCADMSGNVREWCQSLYKPYPYQKHDAREDLKMTGGRVFRGGSWRTGSPSVRCASRDWNIPGYRSYGYGFRVARGRLG